MSKKISLTGRVSSIIYYKEENGFAVIEVESGEELITVTGEMPFILEGEFICVYGKWIEHKQYGTQFKCDTYEKIVAKDEKSILEYLSSGIVKGIKEGTAQKIIEAFGEDSLNIIENYPDKLSTIKGISYKRAVSMQESYASVQLNFNTLMLFKEFGISSAYALKIHKTLGADAYIKIKKNPYILCELISGIGFKTADKIADYMGVAKNDPMRICEGIKYVLKYNAQANGHTCLPEEMLTNVCCETLEVEKIIIEDVYNTLIIKREIIMCDEPDDNGVTISFVYLYRYYNAEKYISLRLKSMAKDDTKTSVFDFKQYIDEYEKLTNQTLADEQKQAILSCFNESVTIITGGPGTGKTTIIRAIMAIADRLKMTITLAAPTGRAAKRMSGVCEKEAKTIHRMLEKIFTSDDDDSNMGGFNKDEKNPLDTDIIIVDEMSMVDTFLMYSLLKAVKDGTKLVLVGDSDQLSSVGAGDVLADILKSEAICSVRLNKIFRQAEESMIVQNAHKINKGIMPTFNTNGSDFFFIQKNSSSDISDTVLELVSERLPKTYKLNNIWDIQVLCPMKKGPCGTILFNELLQNTLNPPSEKKPEIKIGNTTFRLGDKVMQTKNDYNLNWSSILNEVDEGIGVFNGDIGIVTDIDIKSRRVIIVFDEEKQVSYDGEALLHIDLAYAVTVHKSQGSEFASVIIPAYTYPPMLATRNLFYTAVTRAKQLVVIVGYERSIKSMVENVRTTKRYTGLKRKLCQE